MKSIFLRSILLTCLLLGIGYQETYASSEWSSKCSKFGEIRENENPDFQHINCLLTNAALDAEIPPEVVKGVAMKESHWLQFTAPGKPIITSDGGIGIMQVTDKPAGYDKEETLKYVDKLSYDIVFNIEEGVKILSKKFDYGRLPKIQGAGRQEIENWYFPIMAYNGTKSANGPVYQSSGLRNPDAYQEKVFSMIEEGSFLGDEKLALFPFKTEHFSYDTNYNINFLKNTFILSSPLHISVFQLKTGVDVVVTGGNGSLRNQPSTLGDENILAPKNAILKITGKFEYDVRKSSKNQFVWFPVKTKDGKQGYISSAYIKKASKDLLVKDVTAPSVPTVNDVYDNVKAIKGKAESNATVYALVGKKQIGKVTAKNGVYTIKITALQKAGTKISVYAVDAAKNKSKSRTVTVIDKTAPSVPTVSTITSKTTTVTGKAERGATVYIYNGSKKVGKAIVDSRGNYKIKMKTQKKKSSLRVYAQDKAGNKSKNYTKTVK